MSVTPDDEGFMAAAIRLSRQHLGRTATNPSVGCLIVRDGVIVGQAVTALGGRPHAEPQALAEAGQLARGATAYVTLEPCSHHGKTPPCAEALIAYGVARVVISVTDPDPRVSGRGITMLRDAGIEVDAGVLEAEGRRSLAGYLTRQTKNRPYVTLKLAVSADGMIGRQGEGQVAITGPEARAEVQALRAETDAILVGIGTAISDDPLLTVRTPGLEAQSPIRIVLDPSLALPLTSKLVATAREVPVILVASENVSPLAADAEGIPPSVLPDIFPTRGEIDKEHDQNSQADSSSPATEDVGQAAIPQPISPLVGGEARAGEAGPIDPADRLELRTPGRAEGGTTPTDAADLDSRRAVLVAAGVEIVYCNPYHPEVLLPALATRGISSLLVEGGAKTARLFLEAGLVDRIELYQAPVVIGEGGIESPLDATDIPSGFTHMGTQMFGVDRLDEYERGL
ncbi:bifunctional diaminohydroxyphosphoribosylaminopyrimidine deaminase/5-amino-6-(5-phosphoribosylamino)uracil reductase [Rhizobium phaseoli]|uniref:bifunctional diaminohydroxyphosphoribosylaminopyrimidine deaminase/5-amino-6-(5-phosphoribosylamino)uracil reductase RibD n=1 Tax=Rhizobium phaseoli TaxID=396 RepID=UPI0003045DB7|nr:bifunctional diaminohydroxyphosphoribosylaminopyrimidine deaminase/5-amino-6-(5-phosphoribosylamino)uracil reductase RibD [Rhizobium phaseoli]KKZ87132.1 5-amino-6-(5-phosphoribosylamino)uracil reductase [Rhizobium phaseoli Ch24-10]RDJ13304.1 bifunctional diaminohydroxyphosphoribosylaminopyrimidine deaminase/5-amino-6-(5-phosphoribosylamino)uracil reductase [Rhizobium phaseoli]RDJ16446.1 bifunctional diaminohydroxyphosphoribosylaminopyrimidine deaminase/5-amino-6-(5-phosphoribosylamino)uracil 